MKLRVLHVDDDPIHRDIVKEVLEGVREAHGLQWQYANAHDAQSALQQLEAWTTDGYQTLLISDYVMPRMNGVEMLRTAIHAGHEGVYYVLLTSLRPGPEHRAALDAGVSEVLDKPMDLDEFEAAIAGIVARWIAGFENAGRIEHN